MTLSQAILYYIFAFILTVAFILCGCFIGITLRKKKNAKAADETHADSVSANDSSVE